MGWMRAAEARPPRSLQDESGFASIDELDPKGAQVPREENGTRKMQQTGVFGTFSGIIMELDGVCVCVLFLNKGMTMEFEYQTGGAIHFLDVFETVPEFSET